MGVIVMTSSIGASAYNDVEVGWRAVLAWEPTRRSPRHEALFRV